MTNPVVRCVLLADSHYAVTEGVRDLLATVFDVVVMVADEASLLRSADRLQSDLAIVDLSLSGGNGLELVRRLRQRFPVMKVIILSVHGEASVCRSVLDAGADGFVVKRAIGTDLLLATDAVLAGQLYVSSKVEEASLRNPAALG